MEVNADTSSSILTSIKKTLGLDEDYTAFDQDIIMHINSTFFTMNQLGVGPKQGFSISDKTKTWSEFLSGSLNFEAVKTYVYIKVRLIFDRPETSYAITSLEEMAKEYEWRLNVTAEGGYE